jgi:hypothetical protein
MKTNILLITIAFLSLIALSYTQPVNMTLCLTDTECQDIEDVFCCARFHGTRSTDDLVDFKACVNRE